MLREDSLVTTMPNSTKKFKKGDHVFCDSIPVVIKRVGRDGRWKNHYLVHGDSPGGYISRWAYFTEISEIQPGIED